MVIKPQTFHAHYKFSQSAQEPSKNLNLKPCFSLGHYHYKPENHADIHVCCNILILIITTQAI